MRLASHPARLFIPTTEAELVDRYRKARADLLAAGLAFPPPSPPPPVEPVIQLELERLVRRGGEITQEIEQALPKPVIVERLNVRTIAKRVAAHFGFRLADILSPRRTANIVRPRQIAMYLAKQLLPSASFPTIGRAIGGRDHTTALHSVRRIGELMVVDDQLREHVEILSMRLQEEFGSAIEGSQEEHDGETEERTRGTAENSNGEAREETTGGNDHRAGIG
jgi:hypothetical protein